MKFTFYRIECPDNHFYIGSTTTDDVEGYLRGKNKYLCNRHNLNFSFEDLKIETKTNFSSEEELRNFEKEQIKKFFKKENGKWIKTNQFCLNQNVQTGKQKEIGEKNSCPECGGKMGLHKKSCSKVKHCPECGLTYGHHKKTCLHYTPPEACSECGALYGKHKDSCSHSKGKCQYCGYSLRSNKHSKDCPLYKEPSICSECGGKGGNHKRNCSKAIKCPECGVSGGGHLSSCSKYKRKVCSYCGSAYRHKKTCPLYKELKSCPECGAKGGNHKKNCSFSKKCSECSGSSGTHLKNCSHYKTPTPCPECGSVYGHKDFCSKAEGKCKYCGYSLRSRHHSKDCPLYKKFKSSKSF